MCAVHRSKVRRGGRRVTIFLQAGTCCSHASKKSWKWQLTPRMRNVSDDIQRKIKSFAEIFHPRQWDFIKLQHLHLVSVIELPSILISSKTKTPLENVDSLISNIYEIAEYNKRNELEYHVTIFPPAVCASRDNTSNQVACCIATVSGCHILV